MVHLHQQFFDELRKDFPHLELIAGLPKMNDLFEDKLPKLILMDDLMTEIFKEPLMTTLFTRLSRHSSITLVFSTQNYFDSGNTKTIVRNCNIKIIFDDPMDKVLIRSIGSTTMPKQPDFLNNCFDSLRHFFPKEKYPYILIDGQANKFMENIMFRSHIFPNELNEIKPICFFANPHYNKKH
jgi:hypothetical protein